MTFDRVNPDPETVRNAVRGRYAAIADRAGGAGKVPEESPPVDFTPVASSTSRAPSASRACCAPSSCNAR